MSKKLYVFGDSFSTPYVCVDPADSFWGLAAKDLMVDEIYSYCWPRNCLENIVHTLLSEEFDFNDSYFIVGVPPLLRNSIYMEIRGILGDADHKKLYKFDKLFNATEILATSLNQVGNWEFTETFSNDKEYISYFSAEWRDVLSLEKIYLLSNWLLSNNAKFMIVNLSCPVHYQDSWPPGKEIMKKVKNLKNCIIFKDTYQSLNYHDKIKPADYSQFLWNGHHGPAGNRNWYNKIINPLMIKLGWVSDPID